MTGDEGYDATRDPRTGRPPLPIDEEKARAAARETQSSNTAITPNLDFPNNEPPDLMAENVEPDEARELGSPREKPDKANPQDEPDHNAHEDGVPEQPENVPGRQK